MSVEVERVTAAIAKGDDRILEADFSLTAVNYGATVDSIAWVIVSGSNTGSLGTPTAVVDSSSTVLLSTNDTRGVGKVKATAAFSDAQTASILYFITSST